MSKEQIVFDVERDMKYLFDTIIEQAERVQELEEENAGLHDILEQVEYQEKDKLFGENKRYRELLEDINGSFEKYMTLRISESNLRDDIDSFQTKIYKVLEGEE